MLTRELKFQRFDAEKLSRAHFLKQWLCKCGLRNCFWKSRNREDPGISESGGICFVVFEECFSKTTKWTENLDWGLGVNEKRLQGVVWYFEIFCCVFSREINDERLMEKRTSLKYWHQYAITKFELCTRPLFSRAWCSPALRVRGCWCTFSNLWTRFKISGCESNFDVIWSPP